MQYLVVIEQGNSSFGAYVPDLPGWGVQINPDWLSSAVYTEAALDSFKPSAYGALYHKGAKP